MGGWAERRMWGGRRHTGAPRRRGRRQVRERGWLAVCVCVRARGCASVGKRSIALSASPTVSSPVSAASPSGTARSRFRLRSSSTSPCQHPISAGRLASRLFRAQSSRSRESVDMM